MKYISVLILVTGSAFGQIKTELHELSFISGKWHGQMTWGDIEEYWSEAMGDNMVCAFRCVKNGKSFFMSLL